MQPTSEIFLPPLKLSSVVRAAAASEENATHLRRSYANSATIHCS
jgi:hypothetical protein